MKSVITLSLCALTLAGCSNLTPNQNTLLGGNAGLGTLIGAGAGLVGGAIYNHVRNSEQQSYQQGYQAGRSGQPPTE
jgi:hypothetical protein